MNCSAKESGIQIIRDTSWLILDPPLPCVILWHCSVSPCQYVKKLLKNYVSDATPLPPLCVIWWHCPPRMSHIIWTSAINMNDHEIYCRCQGYNETHFEDVECDEYLLQLINSANVLTLATGVFNFMFIFFLYLFI